MDKVCWLCGLEAYSSSSSPPLVALTQDLLLQFRVNGIADFVGTFAEAVGVNLSEEERRLLDAETFCDDCLTELNKLIDIYIQVQDLANKFQTCKLECKKRLWKSHSGKSNGVISSDIKKRMLSKLREDLKEQGKNEAINKEVSSVEFSATVEGYEQPWSKRGRPMRKAALACLQSDLMNRKKPRHTNVSDEGRKQSILESERNDYQNFQLKVENEALDPENGLSVPDPSNVSSFASVGDVFCTIEEDGLSKEETENWTEGDDALVENGIFHDSSPLPSAQSGGSSPTQNEDNQTELQTERQAELETENEVAGLSLVDSANELGNTDELPIEQRPGYGDTWESLTPEDRRLCKRLAEKKYYYRSIVWVGDKWRWGRKGRPPPKPMVRRRKKTAKQKEPPYPAKEMYQLLLQQRREKDEAEWRKLHPQEATASSSKSNQKEEVAYLSDAEESSDGDFDDPLDKDFSLPTTKKRGSDIRNRFGPRSIFEGDGKAENEQLQKEFQELKEELGVQDCIIKVRPLYIRPADLALHRCGYKDCKRSSRHEKVILNHILSDHEGLHVPMKCEICAKEFTRRRGLLNHLQRHEGSEVVQCEKCGLTVSKHNSSSHQRWHHIETFCDVCNERFEGRKDVRKHIKTEHPEEFAERTQNEKHMCETCGKLFQDKKGLEIHTLKHTGDMFRCDQCDFSTAYSYYLKTHKVHQHHSNLESLKVTCDKCQNVYKNMSSLIGHQRMCGKERIYDIPCSDCNKKFWSVYKMTAHKKSVHSNIRHGCKVCKKKFTQKRNLKRHIETIHAETLSPKDKPAAPVTESFQRSEDIASISIALGTTTVGYLTDTTTTTSGTRFDA